MNRLRRRAARAPRPCCPSIRRFRRRARASPRSLSFLPCRKMRHRPWRQPWRASIFPRPRRGRSGRPRSGPWPRPCRRSSNVWSAWFPPLSLYRCIFRQFPPLAGFDQLLSSSRLCPRCTSRYLMLRWRMNERIDKPLGMPLAAIGQPLRRHEDLPSTDRPGPLHRRFHDRRAGLCRDGALAASACPHRRHRHRRGPRHARRARHFHRRRLRGRRPQADSAQPAAVDAHRSQADRARRRQAVHRPASSAGDRQSAPCRRSRRHGGGGQHRAGARRRGSRRRRLRDIGLGGRCQSGLRAPAHRSVWDEVPDNVLVDTTFGDVAATDRAFAAADHVVKMEFHVGARHRRRHGAARGARVITMRQAAATRCTPAAAAR